MARAQHPARRVGYAVTLYRGRGERDRAPVRLAQLRPVAGAGHAQHQSPPAWLRSPAEELHGAAEPAEVAARVNPGRRLRVQRLTVRVDEETVEVVTGIRPPDPGRQRRHVPRHVELEGKLLSGVAGGAPAGQPAAERA